MNRILALTVVLATVWASANVYADLNSDYWPTWRGPNGTGVAPKGNPPLTWSETKNIKWKVKLPGNSNSSPVIWGDKIFFLTAIPTDKIVEPPQQTDTQQQQTPQAQNPHGQNAGGTPHEGHGSDSDTQRGGRGGGMQQMLSNVSGVHKFDVVCLDRKTGRVLWQKTAREELPHEGHHRDHSFASYSPVTDGKYVWASFGSRGLHCYDINGNHKWSRDLIKMQTRNSFGEGSSASLAGDAVVVVMDHEGDSCIFAFDKITGEPIWKKDRDESTSWATPVAVEVNGKLQVITSATNFIRSYDAKTGQLIWQCAGQTTNVIPTPVLGFGRVYCTSGYQGNALQAIELDRTGDLTGTDAVAWQVNDKTTPYVPSPLLYGDKIYLCFGNRAVVSCYDAKTGKALFEKQNLDAVGGIYASIVGADDRVYFIGREGAAQVIRNSQKFEILATNTLDDKFDSSPAIVGNELYLKGKTHLYCIAKP